MPKTGRPRKLSVSKSEERKENSELRKLRNRMSQKAFRARQAMRIKELEEQLHLEEEPHSEKAARLQKQNVALREQLLECHKKLTSLQVSIKLLSDATAQALGINNIDHVNEADCLRSRGRCNAPELKEQIQAQCSPQALHLGLRSGNEATEENVCSASPQPNSNDGATTDFGMGPNIDPFQAEGDLVTSFGVHAAPHFVHLQDADHCQPLNLNYFSPAASNDQSDTQDAHPVLTALIEGEYMADSLSVSRLPCQDLGPQKYKDILDTCPRLLWQSGSLRRTSSSFSDHIDALEYCILRTWSKSRALITHNEHISSSIQSMLWTFVNTSWQPMTAWHTYTKAHVPLKDLMLWRIYKMPETYLKIVPAYQPTKLQMTVPHPSIIDWIPWPSLRDKLIIHHSGNPCLDNLICDIGNSYVVPSDLSILVKNPHPVVGYVGVWDLVRAIAPEATQPSEKSSSKGMNSYPSIAHLWNTTGVHCLADAMDVEQFDDLHLPAEDADTLFGSRSLALQAFKALGMSQGAFTFRLDPGFFERHPELYDGRSNLMAQGIALRPNQPAQMSAPQQLDLSVFGQYEEMSRYLIDSMFE